MALPLQDEEPTEEIMKRGNIKVGELVRNYVKIGAYLGAVYVFLERNKILGTNKVTTASMEFQTTSIIADPCVLQTASGVPVDIISAARSMCLAAHMPHLTTPQQVMLSRPLATVGSTAVQPMFASVTSKPMAVPAVTSIVMITDHVNSRGVET